MAIMIPQHPVAPSSALTELYRDLYDQLGPDYKIYQHLDSKSPLSHQLVWIQYKQQSLFIYISQSSEENLGIDKAEEQILIQKKIVTNPEIESIISFKKSLLPKKAQAFHNQLTPFIVIYNNIPKEKLNISLKSSGIFLLGKDALKRDDLVSLLHKFMGCSGSKKIHRFIRHSFSPETIVSTEEKGIYNFLDSEQEVAVKTDIAALPAHEQQVTNYNLCGVNGGSSSGKTEIILQRAKLLRSLNPDHNILILSSTEASQEALKKRFKQLSPDDNSTSIFSINKWCEQQLGPSQKLIHNDEAINSINSAINQHLNENKFSKLVFLRELDFIQGNVIKDKKDYLNKRQVAQLNDEKPENIWKAVQTLKKKLESENALLCTDLPTLLWKKINKNKSTDQYDHILIDDAHYYSPLVFEIVKKSLKPKSGQLYISQDPRQGILNPTSLWKDTGLDLRGKSTRLLNSYQSNPYILNAANAFYMHRLPDDTDKVIQFNFTNDKAFKKPELLHFNTERDEDNRLLNKIRELLNQGVVLNDILLITAEARSSKHLAELIKQTLKLPVNLIPDSTEHPKAIKLCEINKVRGYKSPYVLIFGLQKLFCEECEKAQETTTIDIENFHQAIYIENTRKLNVAMTCAQKELTLFLTADVIPEEFISPHIIIPTNQKNTKADVSYLSY